MQQRELGRVRIAIIGSGFAGLGMAIRLRQAGITDFVVLERAEDVGGTWRDNTYPGCACDVPSNLYAFSFAPNPHWSRTFSGQREIWDYLRACAQHFGVTEHLRLGHEVMDACWQQEHGHWRVQTRRGSFTATVLVSAMGPLSEPALPAIPGLTSFAGTTFHSAAWEHDHDLTGERVAVIGTGASAIQFVPRIAGRVAALHVFQRTPPWIVPRGDRDVTGFERHLFRAVPAAQRARRAVSYLMRELAVPGLRGNRRLLAYLTTQARRHLEEQVADPLLRAALTPDYAIGCKRILLSDDYYPALALPQVELVTAGIREVRAASVMTSDGVERPVDTIIFGTGFHVTDMPGAARLRGRDGRSLREVWGATQRAYLGSMVAGFPNLFLLLGPNTGLGHNSIVYMIESQLAYVMDALRVMEARGSDVIEVSAAAQDRYNRVVQADTAGTVWTAGGCRSWYLDATGANAALWPSYTWSFRRRTRRFVPSDHVLGLRLLPAATGVPGRVDVCHAE